MELGSEGLGRGRKKEGLSGRGRARTKWVVVTMTVKCSRNGEQTRSSLDSGKTHREILRAKTFRDPVPGYELALPFLLPAAEWKLSSFQILVIIIV